MRMWLLGSSDPEMNAIEEVLLANGELCAHATKAGARVRPGQQADPAEIRAGVDTVVLVECDVPIADGLQVIHIDHHNPGDPGYHAGPAEYLQGSSLGQVLSILGLEPTRRQRIIAACDHNLRAAYAGLCPGVTRDDVLAFRLASRAAWQSRSIDDVRKDVNYALVVLDTASSILIEGEIVRDVRDVPNLPELVDAAMYRGYSYIARTTAPSHVLGYMADKTLVSAPIAVISAVMSAPADYGIKKGGLYGSPARGFCGGATAGRGILTRRVAAAIRDGHTVQCGVCGYAPHKQFPTFCEVDDPENGEFASTVCGDAHQWEVTRIKE